MATQQQQQDSPYMGSPQNTASSMADEAEEMATSLASKAQDVTTSLSKQAQDITTTLSRQAQEVTESLAGQAQELRAKFSDYEEQARELIRQQPVVAILGAVGIGYLVARMVSRETRYRETRDAR